MTCCGYRALRASQWIKVSKCSFLSCHRSLGKLSSWCTWMMHLASCGDYPTIQLNLKSEFRYHKHRFPISFKHISKATKTNTVLTVTRASTWRWKHGYLEVYVQICQLAAPSTARRCDCSIHLLQPWADACRCHHVTVDIMALVQRWISRWNGATLEHKFNLSGMWMGNDGDGLWCFNSSFFGQISVHSNIQHRCLEPGCALPPNRTDLSFAGANQLRTGWGLREATSVPSPCAHGGCYGRTLFAASVLQDTTTLQPTLRHCGVIPQCHALPKGTWPLQSE